MYQANYYSTKTRKFIEIWETENGARTKMLFKIYVRGKKQAREMAKYHSAECWNF